MHEKFNQAVEIVLAREGLLSDDPHDIGGLTKYGISQKAYPNLDIAKLTQARAIEIYRKDYWDAGKCELMTWPFALCVFDGLVNQGPACLKLLQQSVGAKPDGLVGKKTIDAINGLDDVEEGVATFMALRAQRYAETAGFARFGKGWMKRLFHVFNEAMNA